MDREAMDREAKDLVSVDVLIPMIQFRFQPGRGGHLWSVRLFFDLHDYDVRDIMGHMRTLVDDGLDICHVDYTPVDGALYSFVLWP